MTPGRRRGPPPGRSIWGRMNLMIGWDDGGQGEQLMRERESSIKRKGRGVRSLWIGVNKTEIVGNGRQDNKNGENMETRVAGRQGREDIFHRGPSGRGWPAPKSFEWGSIPAPIQFPIFNLLPIFIRQFCPQDTGCPLDKGLLQEDRGAPADRALDMEGKVLRRNLEGLGTLWKSNRPKKSEGTVTRRAPKGSRPCRPGLGFSWWGPAGFQGHLWLYRNILPFFELASRFRTQ